VTATLLSTRPTATTALVGDRHGALLAGPPEADGPEALGDHLARLGAPPDLAPTQVLTALRECGVEGRGGGGFPVWRKLQTAIDAPGEPVLIVNCSESEPGSRKDWALCALRPHLVLDGAAAMARAIGARSVTLHLHRESTQAAIALRTAVHERPLDDEPLWGLSRGPGGYVSGEASAVARFTHEGVARPTFGGIPLARRGPSGRPTVVSNAETAAQVAALLRFGPARMQALGSAAHPGSSLVTVTGAVDRPGTVVEVVGPTTIGDLLSGAAGVAGPPLAVLVGGYCGTWLPGPVAWGTPMEPHALAALGASRGCGLIGVLPHGACGLAETAHLAVYMASQSAGQCGPCVHGLPSLAQHLQELARGRGGRRNLRQMEHTVASLPGSGACRHPDGVAHLARSALTAFGHDVVRHRRRKPCPGVDHPPVFVTATGHGEGVAP
jgi:NADH:ubiquinone oxidoreductase subunit F (NADH-binding)